MKTCPNCGKESLYFKEISTGGDGLLFCKLCTWVEDPTIIYDEDKNE